MTLILISGGVRSGKSQFAEDLANQKGAKILYQATGIACDQEMEERIEKHQKRRPEDWGLLESSYDLVADYLDYDVVLVDCLSTWVSNRLIQEEEVTLLSELEEWLKGLESGQQTVIVVTSEVGLGGVAMSSLGRKFQDLLGEANQRVARQAQEVYAVISGIPWRIK